MTDTRVSDALRKLISKFHGGYATGVWCGPEVDTAREALPLAESLERELAAAKATIEVLSRSQLVEHLIAALEDIKAGRVVPFEDIEAGITSKYKQLERDNARLREALEMAVQLLSTVPMSFPYNDRSQEVRKVAHAALDPAPTPTPAAPGK